MKWIRFYFDMALLITLVWFKDVRPIKIFEFELVFEDINYEHFWKPVWLLNQIWTSCMQFDLFRLEVLEKNQPIWYWLQLMLLWHTRSRKVNKSTCDQNNDTKKLSGLAQAQNKGEEQEIKKSRLYP